MIILIPYDKLYADELPDLKDFYSLLSSVECSNKDYTKAQIVWNTFRCKNILDYHNIYLISDVLLLADIWDNFRNVCYKVNGLDCCYDLNAIKAVNIEDNMKYIFASFHGDTNGLRSEERRVGKEC